MWLVIDGYEDEPAAFGVPPYIGFHIRYICGVLESHGIEYRYITIDQWRRGDRPNALKRSNGASGSTGSTDSTGGNAADIAADGQEITGCVLFAGAIVPGKYLRGAPISLRETEALLNSLPDDIPVRCGGWAIRGWRQQGWRPRRNRLFLSVQDTDATLHHYLAKNQWAHKRRTSEQWTAWAHAGARSRAISDHPDLTSQLTLPPFGGREMNPNRVNFGEAEEKVNRVKFGDGFDDKNRGPLTYEVEVYQGCVRYKQGCKFCIEPKKGVPIWRSPADVIEEVKIALDAGVRHVRLGGMTDTYSYMAEGVTTEEYPIPDPEPITQLLTGLREDERLQTLHVDNANPSIIAENLEPAAVITKMLVETLSDGAVLSFGLESADPAVHSANWLNCDIEQLKVAVRHINEYGRARGVRGLPKLLPGLNFIAGLNGETSASYEMNKTLLRDLRSEDLWLRRINIRQVEGEGFQEIPEVDFHSFKTWVRDEIDAPLLAEMLPIGTRLNGLRWESHGGRTRLPAHLGNEHRRPEIHGRAGITFGRQIGAYPILTGVPYLIPLEAESDVIVTGHGARSITGVEVGLDLGTVSQKQLEAIPGVGEKSAWKIITARARALRQNPDEPPFKSVVAAFDAVDLEMPELATSILTLEKQNDRNI